MSNAVANADGVLVAEHFESAEQQEEACTLGMWLFLAQEFMFFGGMFAAYAYYRYVYHEAWFAASGTLDWRVGALNTSFLLLSSYTMAMGVYFTQIGDTKRLITRLWATLGLGIVFVAMKLYFEWAPKIANGVVPGELWSPNAEHHHYGHLAHYVGEGGQGALQIFYWLYFVMTGMHALHMVIGFAILAILIVMAYQGKFGPKRYMPILFFGLYWHFVDIVWVFLYPMFYLVT